MLPAAYLRKRLTKPLPIKGGPVLRTIGDAANYMLTLPTGHVESRNGWQHAAKLIMEQAAVDDVSHQVYLALFLVPICLYHLYR
jgi:hypothetical protein